MPILPPPNKKGPKGAHSALNPGAFLLGGDIKGIGPFLIRGGVVWGEGGLTPLYKPFLFRALPLFIKGHWGSLFLLRALDGVGKGIGVPYKETNLKIMLLLGF
jgi:hypothetical protein